MGSLDSFKLGTLSGATAVIMLVAFIIAIVLILAVVIVCAIKAVKEKRDEREDEDERTFFAAYGVLPEEVRLNQRIAVLRDKLRRGERNTVVVEEDKEEPVEQPVTEPVVEEQPQEVKEEPIAEEITAEPVAAPVEEPVPVEEPAPVEETTPVEEVAPTEEPAPVEEPIAVPVEEPVAEEPEKVGVDKPDTKKVTKKKKPDDWSKYDGEYEGYYYDPEDACYYEGKPSAALAKKLAAKQAELDAENEKNGKKVIIKKIAPPFATLKTPKHPRQTPKEVEGFDVAVIYGKYVIEHVGDEWFYTLYSNTGETLYESGNYSTLDYCQRAIVRFKTHAIVGTYIIENTDGKYCFVIKRKTYTHRGAPHDTYEEAQAHSNRVRDFAQTDIIREQ